MVTAPRRPPFRAVRVRAGLRAATVGVLFAAATVACSDADDARLAPAPAAPRSVTVTATGRHRAHPDVARVDLRIEREGPAAASAWSVAEDRLQDLEALLEAASVARTDIVPLEYVMDERWLPPGDAPTRRYRAELAVRATVRELARLPDVLSAATEAGVEAIDGVRFGFSDPAPLRERARESAIGAARAQAQTLAEESQQRLGRVLAIREEPEATPADPGLSRALPYEFAVTVTATYALSDY